jgi:hypothetical protein
MSVSGVSSSDPLQTSVAQGLQNKFQQIQAQFQKIGQDLQSGNLTQAQADYATLSKQLPGSQQASTSTAAGPTSTLAKAFQTLGQDLQAGNLAASQADFATIQQDTQLQGTGQAHGHHHHHGGAASSQQTDSTLQQDLTSLGKALQSGSLSTAQQAYSTLQSDLQQDFPNLGAPTASVAAPVSSSPTGSGAVNVTA